MMTGHISPYHAPNFYRDALAKGQHRDIVGGRWEETGKIQMALLLQEGVLPQHHFLDVGCGSLRLGCKAVPYLEAGHYWGTDLSADLMAQGYATELLDQARLPYAQLVQDSDFSFTGIPDNITHILAFAVFTHLPMNHLRRALLQIAARFPNLQKLMFTVFLAPDATASLGPVKQPDGVVTHDIRAPYHLLAEDIFHLCTNAGFEVKIRPDRLPRGQVLCVAQREPIK